MQIVYTARASATGGREGHAASDDGKVDVKLSVPKEQGGDGGPGTNPEQLFAAGYSACYLGALKFVARQAKVAVSDQSRVSAEVGIGGRDDKAGFGLAITLSVSLPGVEHAVAEELAAKAHVVCPYSHSIKGNVEVTTRIV